ncbi:MAG: hypothetical protein KJ950_06705 [Proteobacteria bacterium]|nr:hypothetical protein [Pseudomonadota bacterium]MBU1687224.1 hypothetical protein [Pseudomonadota bacterium]
MKKIIEIDQDLLASSPCDNNHICLSGGIYCSVMDTLGHDMLQMECVEKRECRHHHTYGAMHICNCSVRLEIYRKYGV